MNPDQAEIVVGSLEALANNFKIAVNQRERNGADYYAKQIVKICVPDCEQERYLEVYKSLKQGENGQRIS